MEERRIPRWLDDLGRASAGIEVPAPLRVPDRGGRRAAVLILCANGPLGPDLLLIRRSGSLRQHPGEAAFPGGVADPQDATPSETALRESAEEVGLDRSTVDIVTEFPELFIPTTRYRVTPVLAWWRSPRVLAPWSAGEVRTVERIPLSHMAEPEGRLMLHRPSGVVLPAFIVHGDLIWGMTAFLVDRILALSGRERPWNVSVVELPASQT